MCPLVSGGGQSDTSNPIGMALAEPTSRVRQGSLQISRLLLLFPAHQQRPHPRGKEGVRVPLGGLLQRAEAL